MQRSDLQRNGSLLLIGVVTLAFARVVWPYIGAVFWAVVLAIVLEPVHRHALGWARRQQTLAALLTLVLFLLVGGVPLAIVAALVLRQATAFYTQVASGQIDFGAYLGRVTAALPRWVFDGLDALGLGDFASIQTRLANSAGEAGRFVAAHAFNISLSSFGFLLSFAVMLYLLFFFLRDGRLLAARVGRALPLAPGDVRSLARTFVTVVRATVKGGVAMAATQGLLGGLMFRLLEIPGPVLWGVVFGLLSMLPAVGAGLLWAPIAVYFIVTGSVGKGLVLAFFGSVVLTIVDNLLRPLLVGRDTHMPGYLVLISTLGGVTVFGLNGVIVGPLIAALFVAAWTLFSDAPEPSPAAREAPTDGPAPRR
jgi:predicted PurR-regulated permease PerM